jgi:uncharacterized pyridoxamine 5'-phosphate oxidase family protein
MKKFFKLYLLLVIPFTLSALDLTLEIKSTYVDHKERPTDKAYHIQEDGFKNEIAVIGYQVLSNKTHLEFTVSNRLEESYIDKFKFVYNNQFNNHYLQSNLGTIQSMKGIFDNSKNSTVQTPIIHKASGVYNDEFMSGFLDTTIGFEQKYSYMLFRKYTIGVDGYYSKIRTTDNQRAESSAYNYESELADIEFNDPIIGLETTFDYKDKLHFFANNTKSKFTLVKTHDYTDLEILTMYLTKSPLFEKVLLFTSDTPYEFDIDRYGGVYKDTNFMLGYEHFDMKVDHPTNDFESKTSGEYLYLGWFTTDNITPYYAYGRSFDDEDLKLEEHTLGFRHNITDDLTFLLEWRETDWLQTKDHEAYQELKSNSKKEEVDAKLWACQIMYKFR